MKFKWAIFSQVFSKLTNTTPTTFVIWIVWVAIWFDSGCWYLAGCMSCKLPKVPYEILACVCRALEAWSGLPQNKRVLMDVVVASFVANFLSLVGQVNLPNQSADFGIQWDSCGPRFSDSEHINWFILQKEIMRPFFPNGSKVLAVPSFSIFVLLSQSHLRQSPLRI